jgi:hypothetical protein
MPDNKIEVTRGALLKAFKSLAVFSKGANPPDLVVYTKDSMLFLSVGSMTCNIPVQGSLDGVGYVTGKLVKSIRSILPEVDPIIILQSKERLGLANIRFPCRWETTENIPQVKDPKELSLIEILGLKYKYTSAELERSGLLPALKNAEEMKVNSISKAVVELLLFNIKFSQVESLVDDSIKRSIAGIN